VFLRGQADEGGELLGREGLKMRQFGENDGGGDLAEPLDAA
jgi:hypothetical protein